MRFVKKFTYELFIIVIVINPIRASSMHAYIFLIASIKFEKWKKKDHIYIINFNSLMCMTVWLYSQAYSHKKTMHVNKCEIKS